MAKTPIIPAAKPFAFFWQALTPFTSWAVLAVLFVILAAAASQSTNYFFKLIVDAVEQNDSSAAMLWGLLFPVAILIVQLLYRASGYFTAHLTNKSIMHAQNILVEYILRHGHQYYSNRFAGAVANKIRNVVGAVDDTIPDFLWNFLDTVVSYLVTIILISFIDSTAAVVFVMMIVCLTALNVYFTRKKSELSKVSAEVGSAYQARVVDTITNIGAVRQFTNAESERSVLKVLSLRQHDARLRSWLYSERILCINNLLLFLFACLMVWLLVRQWKIGEISTGDFVLAIALYSQLTGSLMFIGQMLNRLGRSLGEMKEGLNDLVIPYEINDVAEALPFIPRGGRIEFSKVSFKFDQNKVFDELSLTILPGQRVGVVGSSGAGKSTFVSLLLRQYDVESGQILIDGMDISLITQDSLRAAIAVVPQEPLLFHRTIGENIVYGQPSATQNEIETVAKKAQAHEFIMRLPEGYNTMVGERGVKLSGGQKQRIAIARAMLKNAPILVLDEATSALDSESEVAIQKALHELMVGKTVIAIAHRLSTLREMDRIIVLEQGTIVEDGPHDVLVAAGSTYARLWTHQSGGFV